MGNRKQIMHIVVLFALAAGAPFAYAQGTTSQSMPALNPEALFETLKENLPQPEEIKLKAYNAAKGAIEEAASAKFEEVNTDVREETGVDIRKFSQWLLETGRWLIEIFSEYIDWLLVRMSEKEPSLNR